MELKIVFAILKSFFDNIDDLTKALSISFLTNIGFFLG